MAENARLLEQCANTPCIRQNAADPVRGWCADDEKHRDCKQVQVNAIPGGVFTARHTRCEGKIKRLVQGTACIRRRGLAQSIAHCGFFTPCKHRGDFARQAFEC